MSTDFPMQSGLASSMTATRRAHMHVHVTAWSTMNMSRITRSLALVQPLVALAISLSGIDAQPFKVFVRVLHFTAC